jgi:anionic cell wall polymer biosynthesis LytR-Cps2A-Psr (LCP) family protein
VRYRKLDANGDYTFGHQQADFLRDSPEAVAQAISTRLKLDQGEWFLDKTEGMPWKTEVLGERTIATRDSAVQKRILGTQGVVQLDSYDSGFDPETRKFTPTAEVTTVYGQTTITGNP